MMDKWEIGMERRSLLRRRARPFSPLLYEGSLDFQLRRLGLYGNDPRLEWYDL